MRSVKEEPLGGCGGMVGIGVGWWEGGGGGCGGGWLGWRGVGEVFSVVEGRGVSDGCGRGRGGVGGADGRYVSGDWEGGSECGGWWGSD